jgi:thymidylate synthase (FAD)
VKQGSGDLLPEEVCDEVTRLYWEAVDVCSENYRTMLDIGVCPEQARSLLPQSMMTEFIETGSLAAYARIYGLRTDPHAQLEIQEYAYAIGEHIEKIVPVSWAALTGGKT